MNTNVSPVSRRMTQREICENYRMSISTLLRLMRQGLPTILVGSRPRFDPQEVEDWLHQQSSKEASNESL